jgi:hypothetical protein
MPARLLPKITNPPVRVELDPVLLPPLTVGEELHLGPPHPVHLDLDRLPQDGENARVRVWPTSPDPSNCSV